MLRKTTSFFRDNDIDWGIFGFIAGYHVLLAIVLPTYLYFYTPSLTLVLLSLGLLTASLLSITMGYHRLFSHRTFEAAGVIEWLLVFFGTITIQGSVVKWSHDHRLHHKYVDRDGDPYGTQLGFWHSHVLWLFKTQEPINPSLVKDLLKNPVLRSQHEHYGVWVVVTNLVVTLLVGLAVGDFLGGFVIAFLLRLFLGHHSTWFINSIAHIWGSRPYSTEHSAVNNFVISLLTYGEGYHNYHHTFAGDYRNGIKWYHFDPSKHAIWLLSKIGLTRNLRRVSDLTIKKRLVAADRSLLLDHLRLVAHDRMEAARSASHERVEAMRSATQERVEAIRAAGSERVESMRAATHERVDAMRTAGHERVDAMRAASHERVEAMRLRVEESSHAFVTRLSEFRTAMDAYRSAKSQATREEIRIARAQMNALRAQVRAEWKAWQRLCDEVLSLQPTPA